MESVALRARHVAALICLGQQDRHFYQHHHSSGSEDQESQALPHFNLGFPSIQAKAKSE
jgi:hypothetical protein